MKRFQIYFQEKGEREERERNSPLGEKNEDSFLSCFVFVMLRSDRASYVLSKPCAPEPHTRLDDRLFFFFFSFIHMCIQCLGHFFLLPPAPSLPPPPRYQAETIL
jgi:hypothetical protein